MRSIILLFYLISISIQCIAYDKLIELEQCLDENWGIDKHTIKFIQKYFNPEEHWIIDDFIRLSKKFNIQFPENKKLQCLPSDDGVIEATKFHLVVFENPFIRILAGNAEPGEREPFHSHCWKSILVLFESAFYKVEYPNGTYEYLSLPSGAYELPPEDSYACTNLGITKENCLRFEVKN